MKSIFALILIIQVISSVPVNAENRLKKGINNLINSLPNFSQLPTVANRTFMESVQEWQRLQVLVQNKAQENVELIQKTIQNFSNDVNAIGSSSGTYSLINYKAYMELWINYRTELMKIMYQVINDVYTVLTVEIPKSLNRIILTARKGLVSLNK